MNFEKYKSTWIGLHDSNKFLKIILVGMVVLNFLSLVGWLKKDSSVILVPPNLNEKSEIAKNKASEGYKKSWAMYTATLIGNVTPENADFVLESFSGMVTGEIRSLVTEQVAAELDTLKQEKVASSFEIKRVTYEPETDKVFVTGLNKMAGAGGKSTPSEQTFEFTIDVKQYSPIISQMASYQGPPKLLSIVQKEEALKKAQEEREKLNKK